MSYQVKRTLGTLIMGVLIFAFYGTFALRNAASGGSGELAFWARSMLICMGALIPLMIVMQIVFHILYSIGIAIERRHSDEAGIERAIQASMLEDELDELVELKASRIGAIVPALGLIAALIGLAMSAAPALALNIIFLSFLALPIVSSLAQLCYYRANSPHA